MNETGMLSFKILILRLLLSAALGGVIGLEREINKRAAGFRTHVIVSLGSCLIMLISIDGYKVVNAGRGFDPARIAAQVVSGVGFLGAGTILQSKEGISGLTTAATIWLSAGIGLACGVGYELAAIATTIIGVGALISLKSITHIFRGRVIERVELTFPKETYKESEFTRLLSNSGVDTKNMKVDEENEEEDTVKIQLDFIFPKYMSRGRYFRCLFKNSDLINMEYLDEENEYY